MHAVSGRCDLSDLPVEQCACRIHGPKTEPVPASHVFTARYAGECVECWEEIVPGEQIVSRSRGYVHEECAGWAWDNGFTPDHLAAATDPQFARLATLAGVNPPRRDSYDTRTLTLALLVVHTYWAAAHPTEPRAQRAVRSVDEVTALLTARARTPQPA